MKKLLALALILLMAVSIPIAASISIPRQVDPSSAPQDPVYGQGLYVFYGSIVTALTGGNFTAAKQLLAHSSFIHVPAEISDAVNTFDRLINTTSNLFQAINHQLGNASGYISTGRLAQAKLSLQSAELNLRSANATLSELFGAVPQLGALTGIPASLLQQKVQPLEGVYLRYNSEAAHLLKVLTGLSKLEHPSVTLAIAPRAIETGSNVTISGRLLDPAGSPLGSREVRAYFENAALGTVLTGSTGAYSGTFRTPYFYERNASLFASFLPSGNDSLVYASATSVPVYVAVTFLSPVVSISAPKTVNAGQLLHVNGALFLPGRSLGGYKVSITGFRQGFTNATASNKTRADGSFSLDLLTPTSLGGGTYPLTFKTGANRSVGPASINIRVILVKFDPTISSSSPVLVLAGFPATFSGSVQVNGSGLSGAKVLNTSPSPAVDTLTGKGGRYNFTITPSITTPNGEWTYTVEVYPSQSWISASPVSVTVFVINPLVLLFPASSVGFLVLIVRRRRPVTQQVMAELRREALVAPTLQTRSPLQGLPLVYSKAVEIAAKATAVPQAPQTTVREYLALVKENLRGFEHFEFISLALEAHLYGGGVPPDVHQRAESELEALRRELEG